MLYSDLFTTIHKHSLFMTPSCSTIFHLFTHVSLLQYSRSLKVLAFRKTLAHISARYPCISSSWTQWVKNKKPRIEKGFSMAKFSLFKLTFVILFFLMGNLVAHDVVASLIYFYFIYTLFFHINLKDICVYVF